jgi:hypothetical protein
MQSSPNYSVLAAGTPSHADERSQRTAGRVYQCLTIAAMLWLLASLWVF